MSIPVSNTIRSKAVIMTSLVVPSPTDSTVGALAEAEVTGSRLYSVWRIITYEVIAFLWAFVYMLQNIILVL